LRTWESGNHAYIRGYDPHKIEIPDRITNGMNYGEIGHADVSLEQMMMGHTRARLHYIEVKPEYQRAGNAQKMLDQAKAYAQNHNATEMGVFHLS
jgi:ribosomal protein S18 acetylase RimI-like enzyme